jgi:predicted CXXCH cytochrome family protein
VTGRGSRALAALALLAAVLASGCLTPEQRHRVLDFFFDGVPPLTEPHVAVEGLPPFAAIPSEGVDAVPEIFASVHGPYSQKECSECHRSRFSNSLVAEGAELCWRCHDEQDFPGDVVHGPMQAGRCEGCHHPHRSKNPLLLLKAGSELCAECHDESTFQLSEYHPPDYDSDCLKCHNPHAAGREYMLRPEVGS